ncbi:hypothetical protein DTQ70_20970 [Runella sp. SP2]|nr:hypothetical protein DTQ70_20970 [Runella sp. SP2]
MLPLFLIYGHRYLKAQQDQPKYLREDNKNFKNLTTRTDNDGWIEFKKERIWVQIACSIS